MNWINLSVEPIQFGSFKTNSGTPGQDKVTVPADQAYYTGPGNDILTCGSEPIFGDEFENGGFATRSVLMSGGQDNDTYRFDSSEYQWATVADASGGRDSVKLPLKHPFNPKINDQSSRIDVILVSNRDVIVIHTDLEDGGRYSGLTFFDPFGRLNQGNKIEKIYFGNSASSKGNKYAFADFYKSMKQAASDEEMSEQYTFSEASYTQLIASGVLNIDTDPSPLDDGSAIQIAVFNNSLIN